MSKFEISKNNAVRTELITETTGDAKWLGWILSESLPFISTGKGTVPRTVSLTNLMQLAIAQGSNGTTDYIATDGVRMRVINSATQVLSDPSPMMAAAPTLNIPFGTVKAMLAEIKRSRADKYTYTRTDDGIELHVGAGHFLIPSETPEFADWRKIAFDPGGRGFTFSPQELLAVLDDTLSLSDLIVTSNEKSISTHPEHIVSMMVAHRAGKEGESFQWFDDCNGKKVEYSDRSKEEKRDKKRLHSLWNGMRLWEIPHPTHSIVNFTLQGNELSVRMEDPDRSVYYANKIAVENPDGAFCMFGLNARLLVGMLKTDAYAGGNAVMAFNPHATLFSLTPLAPSACTYDLTDYICPMILRTGDFRDTKEVNENVPAAQPAE